MALEGSEYPWCFEFNDVVRTVEVAFVTTEGMEMTVRIDVMKTNNESMPFTTREQVMSPKAHPWSFPSTHGRTADQALASALSFLGEHANRD